MGARRGGRGITGIVLAEVLLFFVGGAVVNLFTGALPEDWEWVGDWRFLGLVLIGVVLVTVVVAWARMRRAPAQDLGQGGMSNGPTQAGSPGGVQIAGSPGAAFADRGGVAVKDSTLHIHLPTPEPLPAPKPGQILIGEVPREPPAFQDRASLADTVVAALASDRVAVVCPLAGGRGVGKTQLAAAIARHKITAGCRLVVWIAADTRDLYLAGLAHVAERLDIADPEGDPEVSARRLRGYLETRPEEALLVIDNANDPDTIDEFLPSAGGARILITSTDRDFNNLGHPVEITVYSRDESIAYLHERTGHTDATNGGKAGELAEELGDLPLALTQAAAVIIAKRWSYSHYLAALRSTRINTVLPRQGGQHYPKGTAEAILLSIETIEQDDATGLVNRVLNVLSLLAADGANTSLLAPLVGPDSDPALITDAVDRCVQASILNRAGASDVVTLHRLIGRVLRERAHVAGTLPDALDVAIAVLHSGRIPTANAWRNREAGRDLVEHINAVWAAGNNTWCEHPPADFRTVAILAQRGWAVHHLRTTADLARAQEQGVATLADHVRILGENHPNTIIARSSLAHAYESAGRLSHAIPLYEHNLTESLRHLGEDHPNTLEARDSLAGGYDSAGRLSDAIPLYERSLTDHVRILGEDHPSTLAARNNLAYVYHSAGRLSDAIPLYEHNLTESLRLLGEHSPHTLSARNNVAGAYESAGRVRDAIPLYEHNLTEALRLLGEDHPSTIIARNSLAGGYDSAGRLSDAIPLYERNFTDRLRLLGEDHPSTLAARNNLAYVYHSAGRLSDAIPLYEHNFTDRLRLLGEDHPDTLEARNNLAGAYESAGRHSDAIPLYERNLTEALRLLGEDHPITLSARNNLAISYESAGRLSDAIPLYERNLTEGALIVGVDHPDIRLARRRLTEIRQKQTYSNDTEPQR